MGRGCAVIMNYFVSVRCCKEERNGKTRFPLTPLYSEDSLYVGGKYILVQCVWCDGDQNIDPFIHPRGNARKMVPSALGKMKGGPGTAIKALEMQCVGVPACGYALALIMLRTMTREKISQHTCSERDGKICVLCATRWTQAGEMKIFLVKL